MIDALVSSPKFIAYILASLILAIIPGPGVVFIVTQTLSHGRKGGLASIGGIQLGTLANASAASIGLAAIFAVSSVAFVVVKFAGAAYLIFLGLKTLLSRQAAATVEPQARTSPIDCFGMASSSRCSIRKPRCFSRLCCRSS